MHYPTKWHCTTCQFFLAVCCYSCKCCLCCCCCFYRCCCFCCCYCCCCYCCCCYCCCCYCCCCYCCCCFLVMVLLLLFLVYVAYVVVILSNGHSPANLSNSSTCQKFASLANASTRQNALFWKMGRTRYIRPTFANYFPRTRYIRQTFASPFSGLDTFARHSPDIRQPFSPDSIHSRKANLHQLSEFSEFGEFSKCRLDRFIHKNIFFCI